MTEENFQEFIGECTVYLRSRNRLAQEEFGIGEFERFEYDLCTRKFRWSNGGVIQAEADLTVVGSVSNVTETWLWSWANPYLNDIDLGDIHMVRDFGESHEMEKLSEGKWNADEADGWEMTSVAARLLEAQAAYRSPSKNGFLFLLLNNLRSADDTDPETDHDL